ncbi:Hypothetical predicted protein [Podarcis lilfordi]|uniref:Uncharacterized protein n=1 Tax=Podarcis lilfordi TaxID=74358 RepID=A0AA35LEF1_9SAUR|nr:Hypothetical predicted protein [Podarcis lilfordi]
MLAALRLLRVVIKRDIKSKLLLLTVCGGGHSSRFRLSTNLTIFFVTTKGSAAQLQVEIRKLVGLNVLLVVVFSHWAWREEVGTVDQRWFFLSGTQLGGSPPQWELVPDGSGRAGRPDGARSNGRQRQFILALPPAPPAEF